MATTLTVLQVHNVASYHVFLGVIIRNNMFFASKWTLLYMKQLENNQTTNLNVMSSTSAMGSGWGAGASVFVAKQCSLSLFCIKKMPVTCKEPVSTSYDTRDHCKGSWPPQYNWNTIETVFNPTKKTSLTLNDFEWLLSQTVLW